MLMSNRAVVYNRPGKVSIENIGFPDLVLRDGPGVNPLNVGRKCQSRGHSKSRSNEYLRE